MLHAPAVAHVSAIQAAEERTRGRGRPEALATVLLREESLNEAQIRTAEAWAS